MTVTRAGGVLTELLTPEITVYPGNPAELRFELVNRGDVVDAVQVDLPKVSRAWLQLPRAPVALFPDSRTEVSVLLTVPASHPAGRYRLLAELRSTVMVRDPGAAMAVPVRGDDPDIDLRAEIDLRHNGSDADREDRADREGDEDLNHGESLVARHFVDVIVAGTVQAQLTLRPPMVTAGRRAHLHAIVHNGGNAPLDLFLQGSDPAGALDYLIDPHVVTVPPGERHAVEVTAIGRRPVFGSPLSHAVTLSAEGSGQRLVAASTVVQKPWVPRGLLTAGLLAVIVTIWALVFKFAIGAITATPELTKQVPAGFLTGQLELDRNAVAGSVSGLVTTSTDGSGVARVTVEAFRVPAAQSSGFTPDADPAGSVASGEDGAFVLAGLLPGNYLVRFSAPGFGSLFFGGATDPALAKPITVSPRTVAKDINMELAGTPAAVAGKLAVPSVGGKPIPVTLTVRARVADLLGPPLAVVPVDPAGAFKLPDLPTPGTYQITVSAPGFTDLIIEETLGAGETLALDNLPLVAAAGSLSGLVTNAAGTALGGVIVTATRADTVASTTTPTAGPVGTFKLSEMTTPGTYVMTFALAGFSSQTLSVELGPGEARAGFDVVLGEAVGTVTGKVTAATGEALGGVTVTASNGGFVLSTQSATVGDVGSFTLAGLPANGSYLFTFTAEGFGTESRRIPLDGVSAARADVVLAPTVGTVSGTVKRGGVAVAGATVTISDGGLSRATTSATVPAGAYRLPNLAPGVYTVTFSVAGRTPYTVLVTVIAGVALSVDADLVA
ncbi:MAG: carboxypeptidase regulatory-like domain-containing protein [Acidimicrobiales bacterium]